MNLAAIAPLAAPKTTTAAPTAPLVEVNEPGSRMGTVKRVPFTHTVELRYGKALGEFDQLYDAEQAALELSEGAAPAVAISTFPSLSAEYAPHKPFVLYDVDYALMTNPFNPMTHPRVLEEGDYHHGQVATFGYKTKDQSWQVGAVQYVVDNGHTYNVENLEERP